jgi:hypothetical protein
MNARTSSPRPGSTSINLLGVGHLFLGVVIFALGLGLAGLSLWLLPEAGTGGGGFAIIRIPEREYLLSALGIGLLVMVVGGIGIYGALGIFCRTRRGWVIGIVFGVLHTIYGSLLAALTLATLGQCLMYSLIESPGDLLRDPSGPRLIAAGLSPLVLGLSSILVLRRRFEEFK